MPNAPPLFSCFIAVAILSAIEGFSADVFYRRRYSHFCSISRSGSSSSSGSIGITLSSDWRPEVRDPLGKAFGEDNSKWAAIRKHELWLDLRSAENTFAQMVVTKLYYGVRRVVDEAGRALPSSARIEGLLFREERFDRADTLGQNIPIYVEIAGGQVVNATTLKQWEGLPELTLRSPVTKEELNAAETDFLSRGDTKEGAVAAIALSAGDGVTRDGASDANLMWAMALTGLSVDDLLAKEANIGA